MRLLRLFFVSSTLIIACVSSHPSEPEEKVEPTLEPDPVVEPVSDNKQSAIHDLEIKQARMWARVDELESLLLKQQQKTQILEQTIVKNRTVAERKVEAPKIKKEVPSPKLKPNESSFEFSSRLQEAKNLFEKNKVNKAFLAFSQLEREFDPGISNGEPRYWLGRCWLKMSEYQAAKKIFQNFIEEFPKSRLTLSAKQFLATIDERSL